jgi:hypothetical protein
MALESATTINQLNPLNPVATDGLNQADEHFRLIKSTIQNTFPNITGAITATQNELNLLDGLTSTTAELNKVDGFTGTVTDLNYAKDLRATGVTSTEYDYLDGVTSNLQTQLNSKQPNVTGAATTILSSNLTANRALYSASDGKIYASAITSTELGYLDGVANYIQPQLNAKQATVTGAASTGVSNNFSANRAMITDGSGKMSTSAVTATELGYLDGVTSNIQTQFNNVSGYPLDIRFLTSGTSYTIPAGAKAILIKASGGGGGGSVHANPATGGLGTNSVTVGGDGGTTTVSNGTLGISITAAGGPHGTNMGSGADTTNWFTNVGSSSAGGDIFYNTGASGGRTTTNNFDGQSQDGGNGVLVQKYVTGANVGGQVLSYSLGAGGTATTGGGGIQPEAGRSGYIELWIW